MYTWEGKKEGRKGEGERKEVEAGRNQVRFYKELRYELCLKTGFRPE